MKQLGLGDKNTHITEVGSKGSVCDIVAIEYSSECISFLLVLKNRVIHVGRLWVCIQIQHNILNISCTAFARFVSGLLILYDQPSSSKTLPDSIVKFLSTSWGEVCHVATYPPFF